MWARAAVLSVLLPVFSGGIALCQQIGFTSRIYLRSPVLVSSIESSKEFGFESVVLRNDGPDAIRAVHFRITLRVGTDDEVADERRVAVSIEPVTSKRVPIELGHVVGLRQLVKSRNQTTALAILTIESIEFEDGREWQETEQNGTPQDIPVRPFLPRK